MNLEALLWIYRTRLRKAMCLLYSLANLPILLKKEEFLACKLKKNVGSKRN